MAHAELCPVCSGSGKTLKGHVGTAIHQEKQVCHGCGGKGWVTVGTEYPRPSLTPTDDGPGCLSVNGIPQLAFGESVCRNCLGTGYGDEEEQCSDCNGTGRIRP